MNHKAFDFLFNAFRNLLLRMFLMRILLPGFMIYFPDYLSLFRTRLNDYTIEAYLNLKDQHINFLIPEQSCQHLLVNH
jgi:hypothetical protein